MATYRVGDERLPARFWDRLAVDDYTGCWLVHEDHCDRVTGYAKFSVEGKGSYAHRTTYTRLVGPIPAGLEIDHLCGVRRCCNPDHLEAVTHAENMRRGNAGRHNRQKTHCPQGHPYDDENTYRNPSSGGRACRTCVRAAIRRYGERKRRERNSA